MAELRHFTILGAGIVGVSCALYLLKDGHKVTLIDRDEAGAGCSFGNAGIIQIGGCVPLAMPSTIRQVPKMLTDPNGPLVIRWRYLPKLTPYLARFLEASRMSRVNQLSDSLASILDQSLAAHRTLHDLTEAQHLIRNTGELYVYHTESGYQTAQTAHDIRRAHGVRIREIPIGELHDLEPDLGTDFKRAVLFDDCISVSDPFDLTQTLLKHLVSAGGNFLRANVDDLVIDSDCGIQLHTSIGRLPVDGLVLAAGAYSKKWAAKLGMNIPMDTERGYHLALSDPGVSFARPVVVGDAKFGLCSMTNGVRIAGTAELAELDAPPNFTRAHRLLRLAQRAAPKLNVKHIEPWMGHRPSTPDSLPVIGNIPGHPSAFCAFGHGHLGLTMGPVTGEAIADLVAGRTTKFNLSPFSPLRFRRFWN